MPTTPTGLLVERCVWSTVEVNSFGMDAGIEARPVKVSLIEDQNSLPLVLTAAIGFWCTVVEPRLTPIRLPLPVLPSVCVTEFELTGVTVVVCVAPLESV